MCIPFIRMWNLWYEEQNCMIWLKSKQKLVMTVSKTICIVPSVSSYQGECEMWPGTENLIKSIEQIWSNNTDNIICRQWMTTARSTLETTVQSFSDILESFAEELNTQLHHSFTAWHQSCFYKELLLKPKVEKLLLFVIFLKTTTPSYKMKYKVFTGTLLRQMFICLWLIIHKMKWKSTSVLLLYQIV
jgi:hypothetical protein